MSEKENEISDDRRISIERRSEAGREDPLGPLVQLTSQKAPPGVDRRSFLMRSAVGGAAAVMMGRPVSAHERTLKALATMPAPQSLRC